MRTLFLSLFLAFAFSLNAQQTTKPKYVIVFGVDGLGGYAFPNANTPNITKLILEGSSTFTARCVKPSASSQNWASMMMGAPPKDTNIPKNGFSMEKATGEAYCGRPAGRLFPSIYTIAREQKPDMNITVLHHWDEYARLVEDRDLTLRMHTKTEDSTAIAAVNVINKGMPDLLFLHFDNVDHAGHTVGHKTPGYYQAVTKVDSLIGLVINALKAKGVYEQTAIIVTADHGGRGKHHGWITPSEMNIPWIIAGPGVKANYHINTKIQTYDTAATLAYLLGIKQPDCWKGRAVMEVFN